MITKVAKLTVIIGSTLTGIDGHLFKYAQIIRAKPLYTNSWTQTQIQPLHNPKPNPKPNGSNPKPNPTQTQPRPTLDYPVQMICTYLIRTVAVNASITCIVIKNLVTS